MPLTPREAQRLHVLTLLESGTVTSKQAAEALANHPAAARAPAGEAAGRGPTARARKRDRRAPPAGKGTFSLTS